MALAIQIHADARTLKKIRGCRYGEESLLAGRRS